MTDYPVLDVIPQLKDRLSSNTIVILQAPPGAGKSTIVPLQLMDEAWLHGKKTIMMEPRRLAAKAVAERMADLVDEDCGDRIGYRVRFESKAGPLTRVEVVTEGILTRMLQRDAGIEDAGLIIFDEFHERSLNADLALALTLQSQQLLRPDLRILIMSATLDVPELSTLLNNAPVVTSTGRQFPVTVRYEQTDRKDYPIQRVAPAIRKALVEEEGDILVFLPGAGEIKRVQQDLESTGVSAIVYPLYGDLSFEKQKEAILPRNDGLRKVVLATSIAETSLTIEGIRVVIDSGLARIPRFDPRSGLTRLETVAVSKDAADQRTGRAGRLTSGVCFRLWTQNAHHFLPEKRKPEILEADLASLVLELLQWGVQDPDQLQWVTPPPRGAFSQAKDLLVQLEAADESGITARGRQMLTFPTHPRIAHMLLLAREESAGNIGLLALAADVAALLEERDPLDRGAGTDLTLRVEALRRWRRREKAQGERSILERVERLSMNWRRMLSIKPDDTAPNDTVIGKLVWAAYPERIAQQQVRHGERYKLWNGRMVTLPQGDPLTRDQWICVAQLDAGTKDGKVFLAAPVDLKDLADHATEKSIVRWDEERGIVTGVREKRLGPLLLDSKPDHEVNEADRLRVILEKVRNTGLSMLGDPEQTSALQARILSLRHWRPEENWPLLTDDVLLADIESWLTPFLAGLSKQSELAKLDMDAIIRAILPWELESKLDRLAPERIEVPTGSRIKLNYDKHGGAPVVEVRLQEMFGLAETPTINEGRTRVLLHLLSPGFKPVQVTQDLRSFWENTYHEVRKELRVRYPKHHWPEDPWTAEPVRGAKRRGS